MDRILRFRGWKWVARVFTILAAITIAGDILIMFGVWGSFDPGFVFYVFGAGFVFFIISQYCRVASRMSKQSSQSYQLYSRDMLTTAEIHGASARRAETFGRNRFIVQKKPEMKDTLCILDSAMAPLFYAKHQHSWKTPVVLGTPLIGKEMRTTDVRFEGVDGVLLGEIHEFPPDGFRAIKRWQMFDEKGELIGAARQKPKAVGYDWILENADNKTAVAIIGHSKHEYKVETADNYRQTIASCSTLDENSFVVDIMLTNFSSFMILSFIMILELSTSSIITRGWGD